MNNLAIKPQSAPQFLVKITQGPNKGDVYRISPPGVVIGRDPQACQIAVNDPKVSRQQCRIDFKPDGIFLEDISGKGTTLVNNQPTTSHSLSGNDAITIGDTALVFEVSQPALQPAPTARPQLASFMGGAAPSPYSAPATEAPKASIPKHWIIFGGVIVAALLYFVFSPDPKKTAAPKIAGAEDTNAAIEAVQKRQEELAQPFANFTEKDLYNKRSAQKHYIRGFRDYQAGRYTRAIEAFQTTLAIDANHPQARRYYRLSEKKRDDEVDQHMDLGNKYKQKNMFKLCMAEFEKVLQIVNQPNNKKYQLAKEQIKECRLALHGGEY